MAKQVFTPNAAIILALLNYRNSNDNVGRDCGKEILIVLSVHDFSPSGLLFHTGFGKNIINVAIKQLVAKGYIASPSKGRKRVYHLTPKGTIISDYLIDMQKKC